MQEIRKTFDLRILYVLVVMIVLLLLIHICYREDEYQSVPNHDKVGHARSSVSEAKSKEYKPGDKEE